MENKTFWLNNPLILFKNFDIIPKSNMSLNNRLNAITRLLIFITVILYFLGYDEYFTILGVGLLLILFAFHFYTNKQKENFTPEISEQTALDKGIRSFDMNYDSKPHVKNNQTDACWFNEGQTLLNATYEITPKIQFNRDDAAKRSYMNAKYELTPLRQADGFTEIWRNEPDMCGGYSMIPETLTNFPVEDEYNRSQCNYITRSKIDHLPISQGQNGLISTRAYAEQDYKDSMIQYRNGIMNEHIDRFRRERQHNCPDMKLLTTSGGGGGSL